ncbi:YALI0B22726p [Yarrowia lipolytica CLIB122]|uniref:YALI0B22726p n=2 Tax=Yarrowia lipolytica TaxID=4952 RepID=Q6CDM8_YARLI|nr:YALI0B22726p [Yarrowia lipolytica CLIB122]AOW02088.1 hypothetical protein YALI1_B29662g [Yarrowia lipolytica]KAB8283476.1 trafficking protein particle complex subunit 10 [Yarrowia lipolytica]KAE8173291.1 trafficking protein particle complex subunit 10 [Yarrowia lipolytica]KAJ8052850.1 trafficking protein particle complex subunit 10 [Yarrowia lipolytica]RMI95781.1 trafficking protein particle complex subunit 10 [Yarrowia lipolytica]|eukprot:XP_501234.1 YALI0B22726p [Yarrowia lipolytica CLIB122]
MVAEKKTRITYFDPFGVFTGNLEEGLRKRLPLQNLHWSALSGDKPLRSIPRLDVELVEDVAQHGEAEASKPRLHQMQGLSNEPYFAIMFVRCDDTETYKSSVRKVIRDWFNRSVSHRREPIEWMIVNWKSNKSRPKSSVFDKIKSDFNTDNKKDRCIQVREDASAEDLIDFWGDLISRLKEGVLDTFSMRVDSYEKEIAKLEAQKNVVGWNYGAFFVAKEGLGVSFENVALYDDALQVYDELEASYQEMSANKNVTFVSKIGFEKVDVGILEPQHETDIKLEILANEVSLFDFRCYLFGRQVTQLLLQSRSATTPSISALFMSQVLSRVLSFQREIRTLLYSNKKDPLMVADWAYHVSNEFLEVSDTIETEGREISEARGELLFACREMLLALAENRGWYLVTAMREVSLNDEPKSEYKPTELVAALLSNEEEFLESYRELTVQIAEEYRHAGRERSIKAFTCDLALLDFQQGRYEQAVTQLKTLPSLFSTQGWDAMAVSVFKYYTKCLQALGRKEELLNAVLLLVSQRELITSRELDEYFKIALSLRSEQLEFDLTGTFVVDLASGVTHSKEENDDSVLLEVAINSPLPKAVKVSQVCVTYSYDQDGAADNKVIKFESLATTIAPGVNKLQLETNQFTEYPLYPRELVISIDKLSLTIDIVSSAPLYMSSGPGNMNARISVPRELHLNRKCVALTVSNSSTVNEGLITVSCVDLQSKLYVRDATLTIDGKPVDDMDDGEILSADEIVFENLEKGQVLEVLIPYENHGPAIMEFGISIKYRTSEGEYLYDTTDSVDVRLPISVSVQDVFRTSFLYSRFSVTSTDASPIRTLGVTLSESDGEDLYAISTPSMSSDVVFTNQAASFTFRIEPRDWSRFIAAGAKKPLTLRIEFRRVADELVEFIWAKITAKLAAAGLEDCIVSLRVIKSLIEADVTSYALRLPTMSEPIVLPEWTEALQAVSKDNHEKVKEVVNEALAESTSCSDECLLPSQFLCISVPVPQVQIVLSSKLTEDKPTTKPQRVGEAIDYTLNINSKLWDSNLAPDTRFFYEILPLPDTWTVYGRRKGHFVPADNVVENLQLVPLKTGRIALPEVVIRPADSETPISMEVDNRIGVKYVVVAPELGRLTFSF